jgi:hypothetical protein
VFPIVHIKGLLDLEDVGFGEAGPLVGASIELGFDLWLLGSFVFTHLLMLQ